MARKLHIPASTVGNWSSKNYIPPRNYQLILDGAGEHSIDISPDVFFIDSSSTPKNMKKYTS